MKISYDATSDSLYITLVQRIGDGEASVTDELEPGVLLDRAQDGRLLGIEILSARGRGMEVDRLVSDGLPLTDLAASRLADLGGSQASMATVRRRRPAT